MPKAGGRQVRLIKSQHFDVILHGAVPNELEVSRNVKAKEAKVLFLRVSGSFQRSCKVIWEHMGLSAPRYFTYIET